MKADEEAGKWTQRSASSGQIEVFATVPASRPSERLVFLIFRLERIMAMGSRFVDALVFALPDHRRTRQAPHWYLAVPHLRVHM